jgi:hypothetical protein
MQPTLKPRLIAIHRRAAIHRDARSATQVDTRVDARKSVLGRRVSDRPIVRHSRAQIDVRIVKHEKALRAKHRPDASGG